MLKTLMMSVANIAYVGALIMLLFFVFTLTGMDLFGKVEVGEMGFISQRVHITFTFILDLIDILLFFNI